MTKKTLTIGCVLDEHYAELYKQAMNVAAAYLAHANWAIAHNPDKKLHAHMLITVRVKTPGCWVAAWSKKIKVKDSDKALAAASKLRGGRAPKAGDCITKELPKGAGNTYPASTFTSLPTELRQIAIHYERLLGSIRKAGNDNRLQKRAMLYSLERSRKVIEECSGVLAAGEALRSEAFVASLEGLEVSNDGGCR
ncbi:MAG: hypothetical protein R3260_00280 [Pseudomonas sp.]|nr:hypothetical protein [Pseudomonas sp.]